MAFIHTKKVDKESFIKAGSGSDLIRNLSFWIMNILYFLEHIFIKKISGKIWPKIYVD
jgi:hypothetical protein